jgi:hypothetical protein
MKLSTACFAAVMLSASLRAAGPPQLSLRWNELESAIAGQQVRMVLPGGARIEGRALAVQPEALIIKITKTSDKKLQSKGEASVPRSAVSVLQLVKTGNRWRAVGTTVGLGLVAAAGTAIAIRTHVSAENLLKYVGYGSAGMLGAGIGGYFIGRRADRHVTIIRIVQ